MIPAPHTCEVCGCGLLRPGKCFWCAEGLTPPPKRTQAEKEAYWRLAKHAGASKIAGVPKASRDKVMRQMAREFPHGTMSRMRFGRKAEMTTQLAVADAQMTDIAVNGFREEQLDVLKNQMMPGASDAQLELFKQRCLQSKLNPFKSPPEIWAIPFNKKTKTKDAQGREVERWVKDYVAVASVDGMRMSAMRTGIYRGQVGPLWCGEDGQWKDVWLSTTAPAAAKVGVLVRGCSEPIWGVAVWSEYAETISKNPQWKSRPSHMLAIAAERFALRKGCPNLTEVLASVRIEGLDEDAEGQEALALPGENGEPAPTVDTATGEILNGVGGLFEDEAPDQ